MTSRQPHHPFHKPAEHPKEPLAFSLLPKLINGGIAGIVGCFLMFPFDLAKTRIQNQVVGPNGERLYKSLVDCFRKIVKAEGVRGLYRGCLITCLLIGPEKSIKLTSNDFFRYHLKTSDKPLSLPRELFAAALAGIVQNIVTTPMDLLKIQLQDAGRLAAVQQEKTVKRISAFQVALGQLKKKGLIGMYQGSAPTLCRNVCFSLVYFPVFSHVSKLGPRKSSHPEEPSSHWSFLSGCFAGAVGAAAATPFDVVKTRLQRLKLVQGEIQYNGVVDAFIKISKHEGASALTRGSAIRIMTVSPLFGIFQVIYMLGVGEYLVDVLNLPK